MTSDSIERRPDESVRPVIIAASYSGPLPPPKALAEYEKIVPGSAERFIADAEQEALHRRTLEAQVTTADITSSRAGLLCGFLIGLSGIAAATIIAVFGNPQAGVGMGLLTLGSLVGVFVYGTRSRQQERNQRWGQLDSGE